jgi:hypothetical protein
LGVVRSLPATVGHCDQQGNMSPLAVEPQQVECHVAEATAGLADLGAQPVEIRDAAGIDAHCLAIGNDAIGRQLE